MRKHARECLKVARRVAQALGHDVLHAGFTHDSHYRFAVTLNGVEIGRFTISESPKTPTDMPNLARQLTRKAIRGAV